MNPALFTGQSITLEAMLRAREERAAVQAALLKKHALPILSFTLNIPGPIKHFALAEKLFDNGVAAINAALAANDIPAVQSVTRTLPTGCEYIAAVQGDALFIKRVTAALEESAPHARLYDIDIISPTMGHISRAAISAKPRLCFLCSAPAAECARSRRHSLTQLNEHVKDILWQWYCREEAQRIGRLAQQAMLYELAATPKPGLVDRRNNGAHKDMDFYTFINSACAIAPYFESCAAAAFACGGNRAELFAALRAQGIIAEAQMFAATGGVNTHKGEIFTLGLLCAAWGKLISCGQEAASGSICAEAAAIFHSAAPNAENLYGARLAAHGGFALAREVALPILKADNDINRAASHALAALIAKNEDTNIIRRAGAAGLRGAMQCAQNAATADEAELLHMDAEFIRRGISPGGSADLLAAALLLLFADNACGASLGGILNE